MTIGYTTKFPWGGLTKFKEKILSGQKVHTIREDVPGRWRPGLSVQHVTGNRTKYRHQFADGTCHAVQRIVVFFSDEAKVESVLVDGNAIMDWHKLAHNDGLTPEEFERWFFLASTDGWFKGRIIHFVSPETVY